MALHYIVITNALHRIASNACALESRRIFVEYDH